MAGYMKRKCCGGCGGPPNCPTWCACLPTTTKTLRVDLSQRWEIVDGGVLKDYAQHDVTIRGVTLVKYSSGPDCYMVSDGLSGTWQSDMTYSNKSYPYLGFYIQPNCRGCQNLQQCRITTEVGNGTIAAGDVKIDCYDPCNMPISGQNLFPTNRILLDFLMPLTYTDTCYNECLQYVCGSPVPPYTVFKPFLAEIYGEWECLNNNTFDRSTLKWYNLYDGAVPQNDSFICTNTNICSGGCKGHRTCVCQNPQCTGGYIPQYDYWKRYDLETCPESICTDTHSCWNGAYGNQPPVYECSCNNYQGSGYNKRVYKHWMEYTVTLV